MKSKIHPTYHAAAPFTCNCGQKFTIGSTMEKVQVEVCSNCHPFYTGKQNLIDTAGRVDKFEERRKKAAALGEKRTGSKKVVEKSADVSNTEKLKAIKSQVAAADSLDGAQDKSAANPEA